MTIIATQIEPYDGYYFQYESVKEYSEAIRILRHAISSLPRSIPNIKVGDVVWIRGGITEDKEWAGSYVEMPCLATVITKPEYRCCFSHWGLPPDPYDATVEVRSLPPLKRHIQVKHMFGLRADALLHDQLCSQLREIKAEKEWIEARNTLSLREKTRDLWKSQCDKRMAKLNTQRIPLEKLEKRFKT